MELKTFFCLIGVRGRPDLVLAEYEIKAADWYYARHGAADRFRKDPEYMRIKVDNNVTDAQWYVDSIEL